MSDNYLKTNLPFFVLAQHHFSTKVGTRATTNHITKPVAKAFFGFHQQPQTSIFHAERIYLAFLLSFSEEHLMGQSLFFEVLQFVILTVLHPHQILKNRRNKTHYLLDFQKLNASSSPSRNPDLPV